MRRPVVKREKAAAQSPYRTFNRDGRARRIGLSMHAKAYYNEARIELFSCGIGVAPMQLVAMWASMPIDVARAAEKELIDAGEAKRDGDVLWLVHGFKEQSDYDKPNSPNHRISIAKHVASLPSHQLRTEFRAYYSQWFDPPAEHKPQFELLPSVSLVPDSQPKSSGFRREKPAPGGTLPEPVRNPSETLPEPVRNTGDRSEPPALTGCVVHSQISAHPPPAMENSPEEFSTPAGQSPVNSAAPPGFSAGALGDADIAFDELIAYARSSPEAVYALVRDKWDLPPPIRAGLLAIRSVAYCVECRDEHELDLRRGKFRAAFRQALPPPVEEHPATESEVTSA